MTLVSPSCCWPAARGQTQCRWTGRRRSGSGGGSAVPGHCPSWLKNIPLQYDVFLHTCKVALNDPVVMWWWTWALSSGLQLTLIYKEALSIIIYLVCLSVSWNMNNSVVIYTIKLNRRLWVLFVIIWIYFEHFSMFHLIESMTMLRSPVSRSGVSRLAPSWSASSWNRGCHEQEL